MARISILISFLLSISFYSLAQDWSFFDKTNSPLESNSANLSAVQNDIYLAGVYKGGFGIGPYFINNGVVGSSSVALAKYDYAGNILSLKSYFRGNILNEIVSHTKGKFGEDYFFFTFKDSVIIGNDTVYSMGYDDIAVVKIVADSIHWYKHFKSPLWMGAGEVKTDVAGNILLTGGFSDTAYFDNYQINITNWAGYPFFLKMDTAGNILWLKEVAGHEQKGGAGPIHIDSFNNYYLLGNLDATNSVSIDGNNPNIGTQYVGFSPCLIKYSEQGQFQWVFHFGYIQYPSSILVAQIAADRYANTYICFRFSSSSNGPINFKGGITLSSTNDNNYGIVKVDSSGDAEWARQSTGFNNKSCHDVAVNKKGEVFVLGDYTSNMTVDTTTINSYGSTDIFLSCYDTAGNHKWLKSLGGTGYDYDNKLLVDSNDNLLVMGITNSTPAYFDNDTYNADFANQLFIARMTPYAVGLEQVSKDNLLFVYPNPSNGILHIKLPVNEYQELSLYNTSGQQVHYKKIKKNTKEISFDCGELPQGTYFLKCSNEQSSLHKKILIK